MIDRGADRPTYKQLADLIRQQIIGGNLAAGQKLPSETSLSQTHDLSRNTIRQAIALLRAEGLVTVSPPHGTFVADPGEVTEVGLGPGEWADVRRGAVSVHRATGAIETYRGSVRLSRTP